MQNNTNLLNEIKHHLLFKYPTLISDVFYDNGCLTMKLIEGNNIIIDADLNDEISVIVDDAVMAINAYMRI